MILPPIRMILHLPIPAAKTQVRSKVEVPGAKHPLPSEMTCGLGAEQPFAKQGLEGSLAFLLPSHSVTWSSFLGLSLSV